MSNVANTTAAIEVHLDIRSMSRKRVQKDFWLVLKSPDHVNWRVSTHKLQGYIDIVVSTTCSISRSHIKTPHDVLIPCYHRDLGRCLGSCQMSNYY